MTEGGFLIKFGVKKTKPQRCYAVAFDYDEWAYAINSQTKKITIEIEL